MNKNLEFVIDENREIEDLQQEFADYKELKLKFMKSGDKYNKEQKEKFLDNFYNAKLNTMFSIVAYYKKDESLTEKNNPFGKLDNAEEINKFSSKICKVLSELSVDRIASTQEMTDMYHNLTEIIDGSRKKNKSFLKELAFWDEFMKFYYTYNSSEDYEINFFDDDEDDEVEEDDE